MRSRQFTAPRRRAAPPSSRHCTAAPISSLRASAQRFSDRAGAAITSLQGGPDRMAKVRIPTPLRKFTGGSEEVAADGATIAQIVADMESHYPGIKERLCEPDGRVRRFVNIYVNG